MGFIPSRVCSETCQPAPKPPRLPRHLLGEGWRVTSKHFETPRNLPELIFRRFHNKLCLPRNLPACVFVDTCVLLHICRLTCMCLPTYGLPRHLFRGGWTVTSKHLETPRNLPVLIFRWFHTKSCLHQIDFETPRNPPEEERVAALSCQTHMCLPTHMCVRRHMCLTTHMWAHLCVLNYVGELAVSRYTHVAHMCLPTHISLPTHTYLSPHTRAKCHGNNSRKTLPPHLPPPRWGLA